MAKQKKVIELEVQSTKAVQGLDKTSKAMKGVGTSSTLVSKGFKGIAVAMKAMGWGILIGLLAAVFEAFKRNQAVTDLVARGMDTLQKVVNVVVKVFQGALIVADALTFGLFRLSGASDKASASLQRQRNEVRLLQAQEQLITLQFQKSAEVQRQIRDDESKSIEERKNANQELGRILDEQHAVEMKNANRALEVAENELKANSNSIELQEKVIQAKTKVAEVDERITGQRSEMLVNINSLNRENQQLAKTTGGVSTSVKEATKSYEDLNKEIKTALGLDKTVESITKRIKEATELRAEAIKKEKEELEKLQGSEKKFRKSSQKTLKELKDKQRDILSEWTDTLFTVYQYDFKLSEKENERKRKEFEANKQRIGDEMTLIKEQIKEEEEALKGRNSRRKRRVTKHNKEVEEKIAEHKQKMIDSEDEFNRKIEEARQMARDELDYFLGTDQEKELIDLQEQFDKRMLMVEGDIASQLRLQDWFGQQIIDIKQKYAAEEAKIEKDKEDEIFALKTQSIEKSFAIASSLTSSLGKLASDNVKAQKSAALLGITIDTAASVSSAVRGAIAAAKGNPVLTPLLIAELLAIVFGGMAQAKGILAKVPGGSDSGSPDLQSLQGGIGVGSVPRVPTDNNIDLDVPPVQAFVVESNVTGKQALQNDLELQATL
tara:strand:- start:72 stop:2063 length:1992 start_codon:yes stop_codon:yes gene_type:complete